MPKWVIRHRRIIIAAIHAVLIVVSNYAAFLLRFDGRPPAEQHVHWREAIIALVVIRTLTFIPLRLHEGLWRYASLWDVQRIVYGVLASSALFWGWIQLSGVRGYPRSILLIDAVLLVCLMSGARMARRLLRDWKSLEREKHVLIYGAGAAGEMIVRDMKHNSFYDYEPIGFIDDDPTKVGQRIHGVPVLGTHQDLPRIIERRRPHEILVAMPRAEVAQMRRIVQALEPYDIPIKTLPSIRDVLDGKVEVSQIRNLAIEDLLPRAPIGLVRAPLHLLIAGKRVLVTGAAGSIGSELCRQILALQPAELVLLERYENGLFAIANELGRKAGKTPLHPVIGDVCDMMRMSEVFAQHRPQIVFHAAAHKHVPMMELNPAEAVKNNVLGTRSVARVADRFGAERFVMISTDKAVNPTSVMGVTKRVAEFVVQDLGGRSETRFVTVRFGNVLGSNGSVVPMFLEQIKAGGPVTVTHPDMRRFFMLIPEAVQLVMHAAAHAEGGEIFVLEMGEQIRVADMARNLIRLSGFVPDQDIAIEFIGLRPGEKMYEELVGRDEAVEESPVEKITRVRPKTVPVDLDRRVVQLGRTAVRGDVDKVIELLRDIVPTYQPQAKPPRGAAAVPARPPVAHESRPMPPPIAVARPAQPSLPE